MPIISSPPGFLLNIRGQLYTRDANGNSRLTIGAANSVLWSDGTDPSWSTAPRLANIADTGGTNRITLGTSSPHVTISDNLRVTQIGVNNAPLGSYPITAYAKAPATAVMYFNVTETLTTAAPRAIWNVSGSIDIAGKSPSVIAGMNFLHQVKDTTGGGIIGRWDSIEGYFVTYGGQTPNATVAATFLARAPYGFGSGPGIINEYAGFYIYDQANADATEAAAILIKSQTGDHSILVEAGSPSRHVPSMLIGAAADPTAILHLAAGTTAASTAPLKFTSGALNTTAEAGAIEFLTDTFYATITTGAARKAILLGNGVNFGPAAVTSITVVDGQITAIS